MTISFWNRVRRWKRPFVALLLYVVLVPPMTWPLAGQLGTHVPGKDGDVFVHLWNFRWLKLVVSEGRPLFHTDLMYHPLGADLYFQNIAWFQAAVWLPLQAVVGEFAAYSLVFMGGFAFTGWTTYLLARTVLTAELPAFTAGLVAAFWPATLSHHDHPNLIFIGFVPLALLFVCRVVRRADTRSVVGLTVCITLIGYVRWQALVLAAFLLVPYTVWVLAAEWRGRRWFGRQVGRLSAANVGALLLMLPLLGPVIQAQMTNPNPSFYLPGSGADLAAYLTPSRYHPFFRPWVELLVTEYGMTQFFTPYVGVVTAALVIYGVWHSGRRARPWVLLAAVCFVFALGSRLHINGTPFFPLPYRWLENTAVGGFIRDPLRLNVYLSIPIAVLAGLGAQRLQTAGRGQWGTAVVGVSAVLILGEYAMSYPAKSLAVPAWVTQVATEEGTFAVADLPPGRVPDKTYLHYQLVHGRPIIGGHISRQRPELYRFVDEVSVPDVSHHGRPVTEVADVDEALNRLAAANIRYMVLHRFMLSAERLQAWRDRLLIAPGYEDADVMVYDLRRTGEQIRALARPLADTSPLGMAAVRVPYTQMRQAEWLTMRVAWNTQTAPDRDYTVCWHLSGPAEAQTCPAVDDEAGTVAWPADGLRWREYVWQVDPFLPAGDYQLSMRLHTAEEPVGSAVVVETVTIDAFPRTFEPPRPQQETAADWDDRLRLVGYDLARPQADGTLDLTLYWQARQRMPAYKFFVHVLDAESGQLAAQTDYLPRNWSYPTNWWEANEFVADGVTVPLDGVPPGEYRLTVGVYEPDSGARLPVTAGAADTADVLTLTTFTLE